MPTTSAPAGMDLDALRELAIDVAQDAGALLREAAVRLAEGADLDVSSKGSATDPVSEADRAAERRIATRLLAVRPDDGVVGEEGQAPRTGSSGLTWIVDPLDGTVNFLYGIPIWCVSVACANEQGTLVGAVHDPNRDETFHATRTGGAWLRGERGVADRRLSCTDVAAFDATLVATGFSYDPSERAEQGRDLADLLSRVRDVRRAGSAALDLCWCAAGRTDAYFEFGLKQWDWAAGALLVEEAGGRVSHPRRTYAGREMAGVAAGGEAAHRQLVGWLEGRP